MKHLLIIEDDKVDQLAFERYATTHEFAFSYQVVIVTGTGSEEVAVNALKKGAFDYLIKDIDGYYLKTLEITVKNAITRFNAQNELNKYHKKLEELVEERTLKLEKEIIVRKNAEKNLKKLTVAVEQSSVMILITDLNANIEYVNPKFTEVMGYTLEEIKGKTPNILKSGHHPQSFYKNLWNTIKKGESFSCEMKNIKKDGSFLWENANITSIKSKQGKIINYLKIAEDITEKREINFALKESEQQLSDAEAIAQMGSFDLNISTQEGFCSNNFYSITQIPIKKPLHFKEWRKLMHPDDVKTNDIVLEESIKSGHYHHEFRIFTKKTKQLKWIQGVGKIEINTDDNVKHFKGIIQDITSAKKQELLKNVIYDIAKDSNLDNSLYEILKIVQKQLGKLLDTTNFYVGLLNKEKNTIELPFMADEKDSFKEIPATNSLTSYVLKTKKSLLINKIELAKLIEEGVIKTTGTLPEVWLGVPLEINQKLIGLLAVQNYTNSKAYSEEDKELLEFVSSQISHSIHRKKQEEDLFLALEKATESDRLKTAFLQNISHEVRTPMNGILGFTDLLKNPDLTSEKQQKYIEIITKSSNRLLNTLNDLMDISKLETGQVKITKTEMVVCDELNQIQGLLKFDAKEKGLKLVLDPPNFNNELKIITDNSKLNAILTNLVKNAIKYSFEGVINFGCKERQNYLEFYVNDQGIGIAKSRQKAIFDRFVQADIEDVDVHEGAGLGLSISKSYVEMLGGKLWVKSKVGEGSQFYFKIPKTSVSEKVLKPEKKHIKKLSFENLKVLITEDEIYAYSYLDILLTNLNATTLHAENGKEAIEMVKNNPDIDLILMDIKMPVMSGIAATKEIRKFNKDVIIIAQTAYALQGDKEKTLQAGCNDFISKPIKSKKLNELLKHYFKN